MLVTSDYNGVYFSEHSKLVVTLIVPATIFPTLSM